MELRYSDPVILVRAEDHTIVNCVKDVRLTIAPIPLRI